jgi:hypothetical protein
MKTVTRRIGKLEYAFRPSNGEPLLLLVVTAAEKGLLALDQDRCVQILRECGFLPTGPIALVNLAEIPAGLDAAELERYLREHGAETRGFRSGQKNDYQESH